MRDPVTDCGRSVDAIFGLELSEVRAGGNSPAEASVVASSYARAWFFTARVTWLSRRKWG